MRSHVLGCKLLAACWVLRAAQPPAEANHRAVEAKYAVNYETRFSDAFPMLLASEVGGGVGKGQRGLAMLLANQGGGGRKTAYAVRGQ